MVTVHLNDMFFFAGHGLYDEEAKVENEFKVDLAISFNEPEKDIISIEHTVNYVQVYAIVQQVFAVRSHLLETLAMQIAGQVRDTFTFIKSIEVHIKKMHPPISGFTGSVGVSYSKSFE